MHLADHDFPRLHASLIQSTGPETGAGTPPTCFQLAPVRIRPHSAAPITSDDLLPHSPREATPDGDRLDRRSFLRAAGATALLAALRPAFPTWATTGITHAEVAALMAMMAHYGVQISIAPAAVASGVDFFDPHGLIERPDCKGVSLWV